MTLLLTETKVRGLEIRNSTADFLKVDSRNNASPKVKISPLVGQPPHDVECKLLILKSA